MRRTLQAERALLYVLGFRFQVDQPTAKLLQFATKFKLDSFYKVTLPNGPKLSQVCAAPQPVVLQSQALHLQAAVQQNDNIDVSAARHGLRALRLHMYVLAARRCITALHHGALPLRDPVQPACCPIHSWRPIF